MFELGPRGRLTPSLFFMSLTVEDSEDVLMLCPPLGDLVSSQLSTMQIYTPGVHHSPAFDPISFNLSASSLRLSISVLTAPSVIPC